MNILVTGGSGFVGSALCKALQAENFVVYGTARSPSGSQGSLNHIDWDCREPLPRKKLPADIDCIVHAAATMDRSMSAVDMFRVNTFSTLELLQYARETRVKKFIFLSSGAVYGYRDSAITEDTPMHPSEFYGLTKQESELLVSHYDQYLPTAVMRLFFPYGEGQVRGIIPRLFESVQQGLPITLYNNGNPVINPIYIGDIITLIKEFIVKDHRQVINVCGSEMVTIKDISDAIGKELGMLPVYNNEVNETIGNMLGSNDRLKADFSWPITPFFEGLSRYIQWRMQ